MHLTRQSKGEALHPIRRNLILSYQEIAVPKLYQRAGRLFLMFFKRIILTSFVSYSNMQ